MAQEIIDQLICGVLYRNKQHAAPMGFVQEDAVPEWQGLGSIPVSSGKLWKLSLIHMEYLAARFAMSRASTFAQRAAPDWREQDQQIIVTAYHESMFITSGDQYFFECLRRRWAAPIWHCVAPAERCGVKWE